MMSLIILIQLLTTLLRSIVLIHFLPKEIVGLILRDFFEVPQLSLISKRVGLILRIDAWMYDCALLVFQSEHLFDSIYRNIYVNDIPLHIQVSYLCYLVDILLLYVLEYVY